MYELYNFCVSCKNDLLRKLEMRNASGTLEQQAGEGVNVQHEFESVQFKSCCLLVVKLLF